MGYKFLFTKDVDFTGRGEEGRTAAAAAVAAVDRCAV